MGRSSMNFLLVLKFFEKIAVSIDDEWVKLLWLLCMFSGFKNTSLANFCVIFFQRELIEICSVIQQMHAITLRKNRIIWRATKNDNRTFKIMWFNQPPEIIFLLSFCVLLLNTIGYFSSRFRQWKQAKKNWNMLIKKQSKWNFSYQN